MSQVSLFFKNSQIYVVKEKGDLLYTCYIMILSLQRFFCKNHHCNVKSKPITELLPFVMGNCHNCNNYI